MTRNRALAVVGVVVAAVAIWFLFLRGDKQPEVAPTAGSGRDGKVVAPAAGSAGGEHHEAESAAEAPKGMAPRWQIDLDPEGTERLEGQVLDPDGHGVGGAEVTISSVPSRTTKTEQDGSFVFDKLVARTFQVTAQAGDLVGGPVAARVSADKPEPVVVHLSAGTALSVLVTDEAHQPIAGAIVSPSEHHEFTTGEDGRALVKPVKPGWVGVAVRKDGFAANGGFTTVGGGGGKVSELAVVLHKGYPVSGRVVDERNRPLAKVQVGVTGLFGIESAQKPVETDDKGAFTIPALAAGRHVLFAQDAEHAPAQSPPVTVGDKPIGGVEIVMKDGGAIAGVVIGADKNPVGFAMVRAQTTEERGGFGGTFRQVTADKNGTFAIRGLPRAAIQLRAESASAASKVTPVDLTKELEKKDVQLVLDVQGGISGVVVDDKGNAVPEVQVNAFLDMWGSGGAADMALAGMSTATTDGAGAFTIHGLPDGQYKLWAARNAASRRDWGKDGVTAKVGDKSVRIVLASPGVLKGVVKIDGQSTPPKSALVEVGYNAWQAAGADGAFTVGDLSPGQYEVTVRGPEFAQLIKHDVKIEAGQTTDLGAITVTRGRRLTGKVVDSGGNPVAGATVKVALMLFSVSGAEEQMAALDEQAGIRSGTTDTSGQFSIIGLTPQATNVAAEHPDQGRSTAIAIPEGKDDPAPVTLTLHGYGSVTGKVTQKGQPLGGVTVSVATKGGGAQGQFAQTADDGTFSIPKVPEGPTVLSAMQQQNMSFKSTAVTVTVVARQTATVTIDIPVGNVALVVAPKALPGAVVNAAQVFLLAGTVNVTNAKQLTDGFLGGQIQGMKFWLGEGKPPVEYDELVPGPFSVCAIPITGNLTDGSFQQKIQQHVEQLKVICKSVQLAPSPQTQQLAIDLPAMTPFTD